MLNGFKANCLATLIGSLPLKDHKDASELVFSYTPEIPTWVQLPVFKEEGMLRQFLPGMPGFTIEKGKALINTAGADYASETLSFYEDYMAVMEQEKALSESRFRLTTDTAEGFFRLVEQVQRRDSAPVAVKGQITGPFTFCTGVSDQKGRAIFYDSQLQDEAVKLLALKAKWQVQQLAALGCPAMVFFDEPALAGFGSSEFISISREEVALCLAEVIDAVHAAGGLAGVHVCANTDWSLVLDSAVDIVNFDAYAYFDRFILYPKEIRQFIASGRVLAWGIVPTLNHEDIARETTDSLVNSWKEKAAQVQALGLDIETIMAQSIITPSCGAGSLTPDLARKVLSLTQDVSARLRS